MEKTRKVGFGFFAEIGRRAADEFRDFRRRLRAMVRNDWIFLLALGVVVAAGFWVRWQYLDRPIQEDEAATYCWYAAQAWYRILSWYTAVNNHIFHTLLMHWALAFGNSEPILRLPAFVAGLLGIPALYFLGRRLYARETGLLAAALVAVSAPMVDYATNARGYSLLVLFSLLTWLVAASVLRRPGVWAWIGLVVFPALGLWTLPLMLFPYAATFLWLGLAAALEKSWPETWRFWLRLGLAGAATGCLALVFYSPVILAMGGRLLHSAGPRVVTPAELGAAMPALLAQMGRYYGLGWPPAVLWAVAAGGAIGVWPWRTGAQCRLAPLVPLLFVTVGGVVWQKRMPMGGFGRSMLFLVPFALLAAAYGWTTLVRVACRRRVTAPAWIAIAGAGLLAAGLGVRVARLGWLSSMDFLTEPAYNDEEAIVEFLKPRMGPKDRVYVASGIHTWTLKYYLLRHDAPNFEIPFAETDNLYLVRKHRNPSPYMDGILAPVKHLFAEPELVREFPYSSLYVYRRLDAAKTATAGGEGRPADALAPP